MRSEKISAGDFKEDNNETSVANSAHASGLGGALAVENLFSQAKFNNLYKKSNITGKSMPNKLAQISSSIFN
ncbi:hypothetical protein [Mucilaginibacter segetis]|uniref:Uncharacterized protein n=1 Tax=Mucilaginibacter segetis TaxID=2793071 RepID=A0A934PRT6_9SPHI|nr:hypothetical protein [Mucilaginibacter segetis]MBK0377870.1 hypothetical protein [Mucilaginibacter segetis]